MDLYEDYASMFRELSQRLEMIITSSPSRRTLWMERVFNPLAVGLVQVMQQEGLDLSRPEGQNAPLNQAQRARLAEQFNLMAAGFRSPNKNTHGFADFAPDLPRRRWIQAPRPGKVIRMCSLGHNGATCPARLLLALLAGVTFGGRTDSARAQEDVPSGSVWQPLQQSIQICKQTGKLLVVVTSSGKEPASKAFAATFKMVVDQASSELDMMFSEMPTEQFADALKEMRVTTHPTVIVSPGAPQPPARGQSSGFQTVRQAVLWLDSIGARRRKRQPPQHGPRIPRRPTRPPHYPREPHQSPGLRLRRGIRRSKSRTGREPRFGSERLPVGAGESPLPPAAREGSPLRPAASTAARRTPGPVSAIPAATCLHRPGIGPSGRVTPIRAHGHPAPGTDRRGGPDSATEYHLRRGSSRGSDDLLHDRQCPAAHGKRAPRQTPQLFMANSLRPSPNRWPWHPSPNRWPWHPSPNRWPWRPSPNRWPWHLSLLLRRRSRLRLLTLRSQGRSVSRRPCCQQS